jgi:hypothetical protein
MAPAAGRVEASNGRRTRGGGQAEAIPNGALPSFGRSDTKQETQSQRASEKYEGITEYGFFC